MRLFGIRKIQDIGQFVAVLMLLSLIGGCYSFRGSSVPPHLKTISIGTVIDNSNSGVPAYRDLVSQQLNEKFRSESPFSLVEREGDARITAILSEIKDEAISVKSGEIERERRVRVGIETEYYDAVKKRQVFKKTFSNSSVFLVANASTERDKAIRNAIQQDIDDILLAVVSDW